MYLYKLMLSGQFSKRFFISSSNDVEKVRERVELMASNSGLRIKYFKFVGYVDEINPLNNK